MIIICHITHIHIYVCIYVSICIGIMFFVNILGMFVSVVVVDELLDRFDVCFDSIK